MDTELERLQKEINGKVVIWTDTIEWPEVYMEAILIWPPGGNQISIKPYGIDAEEVHMLMHYPEIAEKETWTLEEINAPKFCLNAHKINERQKIENIRKIASIAEGGVYDYMEIIGEQLFYSSPSCPYG